MAPSKGSNQRAPRRRWPLSEKRRIVELTLREGASVQAVAREHGVNRNSLYQWQGLYRTGKLSSQPPRTGASAAGAAFVPVTITPTMREPSAGWSVVQVVLASGATLRIETGALDADLIGALIAGLR